MRKAIMMGMLLLSAGASASEFYAAFEITGSFTDDNLVSLRVEIDGEGQFMGAHGVVIKLDGMAVPTTGSCFTTSAGGIFCNFQSDMLSLNMELAKNLSGTISARNRAGLIVDTAPVALKEIYPTTK